MPDGTDHPRDDSQAESEHRRRSHEAKSYPEALPDLGADVHGSLRGRAPLALEEPDVPLGLADAGQPQPVTLHRGPVEIELQLSGLDGRLGHRRGGEAQFLEGVAGDVDEHESEEGRCDEHRNGRGETPQDVDEHPTMLDRESSYSPLTPDKRAGRALTRPALS